MAASINIRRLGYFVLVIIVALLASPMALTNSLTSSREDEPPNQQIGARRSHLYEVPIFRNELKCHVSGFEMSP
jgi:hypothetical protein